MQRVFIAINFDEQSRRVLDEFQTQLKVINPDPAIRWVDSDIFHLTLHFLLCRDERQIEEIKRILVEHVPQAKSFILETGELGAFPNAFAPRVVKLQMLEKGQDLANLRATLGKELEKAGFEIDHRLWQPHLTLARVKAPLRQKFDLSPKPPELYCSITKIDLMQSQLSSDGPSYAVLASYELAPSL